MKDLAEVYRALDPLSPLDPGSEFYVERPDNPMDRVRVELQLSTHPRHYLLVGHRGTGKTTELKRLIESLEGDRQTLWVDVGTVAHLAVEQPELTIYTGLQAAMNRDSISENLAEMGILLNELKENFDANKPPVVVIDGLERIERDSDVIVALNRPRPIHDWPVSVICTIPLSVYLSEAMGEQSRLFDRSLFLPGIAVSTRGTAALINAGIEALAAIVYRRSGESIFERDALESLALHSAGIHREMLQLAQRACVVAALEGAKRVSASHAEAAIEEQRNEYSVVLRTDDHPVLEDIIDTNQLPGGSEVARLIRNQLIVAYVNSTTWFDVHPILQPLIQRRRGGERLSVGRRS